MENKMADKTVTTCASVLYAIFQKKAKNRKENTNTAPGLIVPTSKPMKPKRKCSCLCHTYENKKSSNEFNENNKFFHSETLMSLNLYTFVISASCTSFFCVSSEHQYAASCSRLSKLRC